LVVQVVSRKDHAPGLGCIPLCDLFAGVSGEVGNNWEEQTEMTYQSNLWEAAARRAKAEKLLNSITLACCETLTPDIVRAMSAQERHWAAQDAKVKEPVSDTTWDMVAAILEGAPMTRPPESDGAEMEEPQLIGVVGIQDSLVATLRASILIAERRARR
jgi:hypothetical protein